MAYWFRKNDRNNRPKYVFVVSTLNGTKKVLPRSETKHLDGAPDHNIDVWVREWSLTHEGVAFTPEQISDPDLNRYLEQWSKFLSSKKSPITIQGYILSIREHVFPYFLRQDPPASDPNTWPYFSVKFLDHLETKGVTTSVIERTYNALRKFFGYLEEEGIVSTSVKLRLRNPSPIKRGTPLKITPTPVEMLDFINKCPDKDTKFMALMGYFFSLRPQEIYAIAARDFIAGANAEALPCGIAMRDMGLYSRLAVFVHKQQVSHGEVTTPKNNSKGYTACFNSDAAKLVVGIVNSMVDKTVKILDGTNSKHQKTWKKNGYPKMSLKDLRRASLYYLGHHTNLQGSPILLMKHGRHKDFDTTVIYLRRPEESKPDLVEQLDLDA